MEPPKKFTGRMLELAGLFALGAFLVRLGVYYLLEIWPYLLIGAIITLAIIIGWRAYNPDYPEIRDNQSFSIAGRRKGSEDARGTLFFEVARMARAKRPAYLLLENVPYALQLLLKYAKPGTTVENVNFYEFQKVLLPIPPVQQIDRIISATGDFAEFAKQPMYFKKINLYLYGNRCVARVTMIFGKRNLY